MSGKFIVIEGCDKSGKTSLIKKLKEIYKDNENIIFVKEPGFTDFSKSISKLIKNNNLDEESKMHLFSAERINLVKEVILPALAENKIIICERFALSMWAYQCSNDNSLITLMKLILAKLEENINVNATIYIRTTIDKVLETDASIQDKQRLGHLLLWYDVAIQGQEFPKKLLGNIITIDSENIKKEELITSLKDKLDGIINSNG